MFVRGLISRLIRWMLGRFGKESTMSAWHVAAPSGGSPLPDYRCHTYLDCRNLQRILGPQPERRRDGTGGLTECWNCRERRLRGRR